MWEGKWTEELNFLYDEYEKRFNYSPDEYEEIMYEEFTYEEFVPCIRECLRTGLDLDELLEKQYRENDNPNISEIERYMQMDPKELKKLIAEMEAEIKENMKKRTDKQKRT